MIPIILTTVAIGAIAVFCAYHLIVHVQRVWRMLLMLGKACDDYEARIKALEGRK
jgi:hypothetical protein